MPKISVIVPVYNTSKYLKGCLSSILSQSFQDFEVIVINDGSTDQSANILDQFSSDKIRIVHQKNKGIGFTRNLGITLATGDYICFIDSDDTIHKNYLQSMYQSAYENSSDVVICDFYNDDEKSGKLEEVMLAKFTSSSLKKVPNIIFEVNSSPWNKLYLRSFLIDNKILFEENLKYEDVIFYLSVIKYARVISKVNLFLVNYLIREGSETTVLDKRVFDIFKIMDLVLDVYKDVEDKEIKKYIEFYVVNRLTLYNIQQVNQKDDKLKTLFIDQSFQYLDEHYPSWRKNEYYKNYDSSFKRIIKNNQKFTYMIVNLMRWRNGYK